MIFCFSGTGNSLMAAERLADMLGDRVTDISVCVRENRFGFLADGEDLGFVFPVYFYGVPRDVRFFIHMLSVQYSEAPYVYAVLTCGEHSGAACRMLEKDLSRVGLGLAASHTLVMPANSIPWHDPDPEDVQRSQLDAAALRLPAIAGSIRAKERGCMCGDRGPLPGLRTAFMYPMYGRSRRTSGFRVTDACDGCGLCEEICADRAIRIEEGRPAWIIEECTLCLGCLHRCPRGAIEFGGSEGRRRYRNPVLD
ncbi:MAG: EFR1 family ferrodoxin [Candidatus Methanomethylophilaceae archaeon]|nr:EFR1 family ferrodoxin [Candidatus Methanomethylophilaceae archaeon]